jgi:hypothetical protein
VPLQPQAKSSTRTQTLWATAAFAVLAAAFFVPTLVSGRLPSAADIAQEWPATQREGRELAYAQNIQFNDIAIVFEPWHLLFKRAVREGVLPLWNPYQGFGSPHIGNGQSALFFPLNWFVPLLGLKFGLLLLYASKLFLLGLGGYVFLRSIRLSFAPALLGGVAFMFSVFNVGWLYWPLPSVLIALPFGLYVIERTLDKESSWNWSKTVVGLALVTGWAFLAGHPETFAHVMLVLGLYALYRLVEHTQPFKRRAQIGAWFVLGVALGLGVAAVQLLPFAEYFTNSAAFLLGRSDPSLYEMPLHLASLTALPDLVGNPGGIFPLRGFFFAPNLHYNAIATGGVGLTVLIAAALAILHGRRDPRVWRFGFLALLAFAVVYRIPPIHGLFSKIPFMDAAINERLLFLLAFSLIVLAAIGFEYLLRKRPAFTNSKNVLTFVLILIGVLMAALFTVQKTILEVQEFLPAEYVTYYFNYLILYAVVTLVIVVMLTLVLWTVRSYRWLAISLFGLLVAELAVRGVVYNPDTKPADFFPSTPTIEYLQQHAKHSRVVGLGDLGILFPDLATAYELRDLRLYDGVQPAEFGRAMQAFSDSESVVQRIYSLEQPLLKYAAVEYLLGSTDPDSVASVVGEQYRPADYPRIFDSNGVGIYQNKQALPRAYVLASAQFLATNLDPLEGSTVVFVSDELNRVELDVQTQEAGELILADQHFPGWQATVDDAPIEIKPADLGFRSVHVEPGSHRVVFEYRPRSFTVGLVVSGMTLLACVILLIVFRTKKQQ